VKRPPPERPPGHTSFVVTSGSGKLGVQGDVTAHVALLFVRNPDWHAGGDMNGPQAAATRRKLYDMMAAERTQITTSCSRPPAISRRTARATVSFRWHGIPSCKGTSLTSGQRP
jgi:hypothetical protein